MKNKSILFEKRTPKSKNIQECSVFDSIFRAGIDDYTGELQMHIETKNMEGIPVLVGAWDTILKISEKDINFKIPKEWSGESVFKYGDFFLPSWMLESDMDGNFSFLFWAIQEIGKRLTTFPCVI